MYRNSLRSLPALCLIAALLAAAGPQARTAARPVFIRSPYHPPTGLQEYERWFGSQHAHTGMDGDDGKPLGTTAEQAFAYAKNLPHLQYYIITPHVHQSRSGADTLYSDATYNTIRASAASATTAHFVAIAGQEVSTIDSGGHWSLFNASDLVGTDHPDGDWDDEDDYYDHVAGLGLAGENIAAQFDHPKIGDFGGRYDAGAAPYIGTVTVLNGPATYTATDFSGNSNEEYQTRWVALLNLGWKVSPAADQDNHRPTWGAATSEYTVIVRPKGAALNAANVMQGLREHMTYATEDANMAIGLVANGWSMGQTIGGESDVSFTIWWDNPSATIYNNNNGVAVTEPANDVIQNIWVYQNSFNSPVVTHTPNSVSGTWNVTVSAAAGDWFVVKFQDSYTFAAGRSTTKDYTWSAPIWYDPVNADAPLQIEDELTNTVYLPYLSNLVPSAPLPTPTQTPTPTRTPTLMPTPTQTSTPTSSPTPVLPSNLQITVLSGTTNPEYVMIQNSGGGGQDMTGWTLVSIVGPQTFPFPAGYVLAPGATVRIESFTAATDNPPAVLLWRRSAVWLNTGDKAVLYNSSGGVVGSSVCYEDACP
jgi:hypothetical protein